MVAKTTNTKLAVRLARDVNYKVQKNGSIRKKGSDGKYRPVGWERHGYKVVNYKNKYVVVGRVVLAKYLLDLGYDAKATVGYLNQKRVFRKNKVSLDDSLKNVTLRKLTSKRKLKPLTEAQIRKMVILFCEGHSVAKIARRFKRKISRSYLSRIIKRELGS